MLIHWYLLFCLVFLKTVYRDWECSSVSSQKEDVNNYFCTQTLRYILRQWPCVPAVALWILLTAGLSCVMEVWFVFTCPELQSSQEQPEEIKQCRDSITVFYQHFTLALQQEQVQRVFSAGVCCRGRLILDSYQGIPNHEKTIHL